MRSRLHLLLASASLVSLALTSHAQQPAATGIQPPQMRLVDTSMDVIVAAGGSSAERGELEALQGGGHDPKKNGFTLQQAELNLSGVIDPYFKGQSNIVLVDDEVELEEAFLSTVEPLGGWDIKAGYFLTEFGRVNATHAHSWTWVDQPLINTRMFGGEGLRNAGVRVGRLLPLPWFSEVLVGVQNADGEFAASFLGGEIAHSHGDEGHAHEDEHAGEEHTEEGHSEEEHGHAEGEEEHEEEHEHAEGGGGIGGRAIVDREVEGLDDLLYSIRWANSGEVGDETTAIVGVSGLTGPNASGTGQSTWIAGVDLTLKWTPVKNNRGFPFVKWETEGMYRNYEAGEFSVEHEGEEPETFGADTLKDYGVTSSLQYGFKPGWIAGIRGEFATGEGESIGGRDHDPYRSDRFRLSPTLSWLPTEFSRVRVQYNYDDADFLDEAAHTVWVSLEGLWGTHPAHKF